MHKRKLKTAAITLFFVVAVTVILSGCQAAGGQSPEPTRGKPAASPSKPASGDNTGLSVGKTAPDFAMEMLDGGTKQLSDFRGKPVFLNFWATWCGPCINEMPDLQKAHEDYGDKITFLGINCAEDKSVVEKFLKDNYSYTQALDTKSEIGKLYQIQAIPLSLVLDSDGVIMSTTLGSLSAEEIDGLVKAALK